MTQDATNPEAGEIVPPAGAAHEAAQEAAHEAAHEAAQEAAHEAAQEAEDGGSLLAIAFDDALLAQEALIAGTRLANRGSWRLEDSAIVARSPDGRIRIHQTRDVTTGQGAASGGWLGLLAGWIVMAPLAGAALGAALGGLWARLRDIGIDDNEMRSLGEQLMPGQAAAFFLVHDTYPTHLIRELRRFPGTLLASTFDDPTTEEIRQALAQEC